MKIWIFIFLLLNLGMGVYVYSKETRSDTATARNTDLNANQMRLVPFNIEPTPTAIQKPTAPPVTQAPPTVAAVTPTPVNPPAPPVCLEWQHVTRDNFEEAKTLLNTLLKPENISEKHTEEPSRYWIFIPASNNTQATIAKLKAAGVTDVSVEPSQNISLGVYSVEATAKRHLDEIRNKGFKEAKLEARKMQIKEATFFLKEVDKTAQDRLNESLENFSKTTLKIVNCNKS